MVFSFVPVRNEFLIALTLTTSDVKTLPIVASERSAHLHRGSASGDAGRESGRVDLIAFLDAEALATFQVGGVNVTALLSGRNPPSVGAVIELAVHGEDAHVFDAATGLSLVCN